MSLYSDGIVFKFRFQKSRFTPKNREWADTFLSQCRLNNFGINQGLYFKIGSNNYIIDDSHIRCPSSFLNLVEG